MTDFAADTGLSDAEIRSLLKRSIEAMDRNDFLSGQQMLERVLEQKPDDADALQLMGTLKRALGCNEEAEQCYRRAIASNPKLPQAHLNLGNLLRGLGRYEESAAAQREAIRIKSNYVEAHLGLGLALQSLKQYGAAEKAFRDVLRLQPNYLLAKQCLGAVLNEQKRAKEAESVLQQGLALSTRDPRQTGALLHNLGISLKIQRRYPESLNAIARAQALVPDMPLADYNRASVLQHSGRLDEAVDAYRAAITRNPLDLDAHYDLNRLLYRLRRDEEFLKSYDDVAALYPEVGELPLIKASFLLQAERYDEARESFERAAALLPGHLMPHDGLGLIFARLGQFGEAIRAHEKALRLGPDSASAWVNFSETLLRADESERALSAAETAMAIAPENQHALALWSLALRKLGDAREADLNDYDRLVQAFEIDAPPGYADIQAFNGELNEFLDNLHRDRREHVDQSLRQGTQTPDNLFGAGHALVELLRESIDRAVETYIARMQDDPAHPLMRRRRSHFEYAGSWSARLRDCGFHTNHVHPKGWISSAYYIAVPEAVEDPQQKQGWLKFGEPAFDAGFKEPVRRAIKPVSGTLVLFPSYMWHGTNPFHSSQSRTTIAFDVVPQ